MYLDFLDFLRFRGLGFFTFFIKPGVLGLTMRTVFGVLGERLLLLGRVFFIRNRDFDFRSILETNLLYKYIVGICCFAEVRL